MTLRTGAAMALAVGITLATGLAASAGAMPAGAVMAPLDRAGDAPLHQARSIFQKMFDTLADDTYVHDDHYDWQAYRDTTSRKERVKDFYRMQTEMQRDAMRGQIQAQKKMIKAQRGW